MNSLQITEACNELSSNRKIYFCSKTAFLAQISLHSLCRVPQALRGFISKRCLLTCCMHTILFVLDTKLKRN